MTIKYFQRWRTNPYVTFLINIFNSEQQCDTILSRCNGIDTVGIDDDGGCLTKTVRMNQPIVDS